MSGAFGIVQLDPLILSSWYYFRYKLARVYLIIYSGSESIRIPGYAFFKMRGGNIGTWYIESVITVPKYMSIDSIDIVLVATDNTAIVVKLTVKATLGPGTYKFMWLSCVRSVTPIILNLTSSMP